MAKHGVNKVIIIGNLGADPETRTLPSGVQVTNLSVATSEAWRDQQGEQQERTEWHRVVLFNRGNYKMAEYAAGLSKGEKVYIEGRLQTRKWQDQSGQDRYATEIVAEEFQRMTPISDKTTRPAKQPANQARDPRNAGGKTAADFDEDIPF